MRPAAPADSEAVGALLVRAYEAAWGATGWDDYRAELLDVEGRRGRCETIVASVVAGAVVGCVSVVVPGSPMRSVVDVDGLEVRMLAVDPGAQRRGVARRLLSACAARAVELGLERLVLQSDDDLVAAHSLYSAVGFRRRPDLDVAVGDGHRAFGYALSVGSGSDSGSGSGSGSGR